MNYIYEEETGCVCVYTARDDVNKNFTITSCKIFYVVFVPLAIGQVSNEMCTQKNFFDDIIICSINSCTALGDTWVTRRRKNAAVWHPVPVFSASYTSKCSCDRGEYRACHTTTNTR